MTCAEIKIGMTFHDSSNPNEVWKVEDQGNYMLKDGKRVRLENPRKNKWHCRRVGTNEPLKLACFDQVFPKTKFNFRMP